MSEPTWTYGPPRAVARITRYRTVPPMSPSSAAFCHVRTALLNVAPARAPALIVACRGGTVSVPAVEAIVVHRLSCGPQFPLASRAWIQKHCVPTGHGAEVVHAMSSTTALNVPSAGFIAWPVPSGPGVAAAKSSAAAIALFPRVVSSAVARNVTREPRTIGFGTIEMLPGQISGPRVSPPGRLIAKSEFDASAPARNGTPLSCTTTRTRYLPPFGRPVTSQLYEVSVGRGVVPMRFQPWPELSLGYRVSDAPFGPPTVSRPHAVGVRRVVP